MSADNPLGATAAPQTFGRPPGRRYTDKQRTDALAALRAHRGNVLQTSKDIGVPMSTLRMWSMGGWGDKAIVPIEQRSELANTRAESNKDMAETLQRTSWKYLDALEQADLTAERPYYLSQTLKILREQHQLLTGGATSRVEMTLAAFLGQPAASAVGPGTALEALPTILQKDE